MGVWPRWYVGCGCGVWGVAWTSGVCACGSAATCRDVPMGNCQLCGRKAPLQLEEQRGSGALFVCMPNALFSRNSASTHISSPGIANPERHPRTPTQRVLGEPSTHLWPNSLVANATKRHLVVMGSVPNWATTGKENAEVPGSIPGAVGTHA